MKSENANLQLFVSNIPFETHVNGLSDRKMEQWILNKELSGITAVAVKSSDTKRIAFVTTTCERVRDALKLKLEADIFLGRKLYVALMR